MSDEPINPAQTRIGRFLRQHFHAEFRGSKCTHVVLRHVTPHTKRGQPGSEIFTWERPGKTTEDILSALAIEIASTADSDASGWDGTQTYCLHAYYDGHKSARGRCTFRMDGAYEEEEDIGSEPPTLEGSLKQQMRHNELLTRHMMLGNQHALQVQARMIDALSAKVESMEQQRIELFLTREKLLSEQADRDLAMLEATQRAEQRERLLKQSETLIPVIVNRMTGQKLLPASDPTGRMIQNLKESILDDEEKLEKLKSVLDKNDWITLMELASSIEEKH